MSTVGVPVTRPWSSSCQSELACAPVFGNHTRLRVGVLLHPTRRHIRASEPKPTCRGQTVMPTSRA
eukprot:1441831-Rhodomonas_salina.4